jgi:hypothetical protein
MIKVHILDVGCQLSKRFMQSHEGKLPSQMSPRSQDYNSCSSKRGFSTTTFGSTFFRKLLIVNKCAGWEFWYIFTGIKKIPVLFGILE